MKNTVVVTLIMLCVLAISACSPQAETKVEGTETAAPTEMVTLELGESSKFNEQELQQAVDCMLKKSREFKGCELKKIWYDEELSDQDVTFYMKYGQGREGGVERENVIVIHSAFYAGEDADASMGVGLYPDWKWYLIRDGKTSEWCVTDWGN